MSSTKREDRTERSRETRQETAELIQQRAELSKPDDENASGESSVPKTRFDDLPLSSRTREGLHRGNYVHLTPIQSAALPIALSGKDILATARTGSGKTLAFIIPVLERLFVEKWDDESGVGALILTPTRELALQIFKVLRLVGYKHTFSAALLTGGRNAEEEKKRVARINIVVGTPGRIRHHLEESEGFTLDLLQVFVMDEADRLLDMGFREAIQDIVNQLPAGRQTLLFSATQSTDVASLAMLSLKDPEHVADQVGSAAPTPSLSCHNFIITELHNKLDATLMFLKRHPNDKIIVFLATCNQVRYTYLAMSKILKKMRVPAMCLTGKMRQFRREEVFTTFCRCKSAVLFCTDIAARGLDFPMVHWVVQFDCPDSPQTYIHRAGRTARAGARGVSILLLMPSEVGMLSHLHHKNIPMREIAIRPGYLQDSRPLFQAMVVQGLKYDAQKAFISYLRSIKFAENKKVFRLDVVDLEKFAKSLGLLVVPDIKELGMDRRAKNVPWAVVNSGAAKTSSHDESASDDDGEHESDDVDGDSDDEEVPSSSRNPKEELTRKERHLAASDMFTQLKIKQRFATEGGVLSAGAALDDDDFLVKVPKPAPGSAAAMRDEVSQTKLSLDERLGGLSKKKRREIVETADVLRMSELNLSKRHVFGDEDDEEGPSSARVADVAAAASDEDDELQDVNAHTTALRRKLLSGKVTDRAAVKDLKKRRGAKKEDATRGADDDGSGNDNAGDDDDDDLFKAMRGELFDEAGPEKNEEEPEPAAVASKPSKVPSIKRGKGKTAKRPREE